MDAPAPARDVAPVVFFDGGCGLCHAAVRALVRLDRRGRLRFAPLGGETFLSLVPEPERRLLPDSLVLRSAGGRLSVRSAAVLEALRLAGRPWTALAWVVGLVPAALADALYDAVARVRRKLFAAPPEACPRVPRELRERFLP